MPAEEVKNLGVTFDSEDTFDSHVGKVYRACYYHLRDLRHINKLIVVDTAVLLANAMFSSRLNCCNSLLYWPAKAVLLNFRKSQMRLPVLFPIRQNESCQTLPKKTPLASHFTSYFTKI